MQDQGYIGDGPASLQGAYRAVKRAEYELEHYRTEGLPLEELLGTLRLIGYTLEVELEGGEPPPALGVVG